MIKKWILYVVFLVLSNSIFAQAFQLTSSVDRQQVNKNQQVTYLVKLSGGRVVQFPDLKMPDLSGKFDIVSSAQQTSYSIVNGEMTSSISKKFTLLPVSTGKHTIGPAEVTYQNQVLRTNSHVVTVLDTSSVQTSSAPGQRKTTQPLAQLSNIFLKQKTSKTEAYVGEQIIYKMSLYRRVRLMGDIAFELPSFEKFWVESLKDSTQETIKNIGNTRFYERNIKQKAIFPLEPGEMVIDSGKVGVMINFFEGQRVLQADPIKIKVKPLPSEGKPVLFKGAVGEFSLNADLMTQKELTQFSPLSVKVTLSGSGNLRNINTLYNQSDPAFKLYPPEITDDFQLETALSGSRQFEYVIVPKQAGEIVLPQFEFSYFSPQKKGYVTLRTAPITVTLAPSTETVESSVTLSRESKELQSLTQELRYLKTTELLKNQSTSLPIAWNVIFLVNLLFWLWLGFQKIRSRFFASSKEDQVFQKAYAQAKHQIQMIEASDSKVCSLLQNIILDYLSQKTGKNMTGLAKNQIQSELEYVAIQEDHIKQILTLLDELSFAAYTPSASINSKQLIDKTVGCLDEIEKEFK